VIKAVNRLEGTIYYQRSHIAEKYLDEFQILILEASYTDSCTIVVMFCHSLRILIQNQIAMLPIEQSEDINILVFLS